MAECTAELFEFPSFQRRKVEASFSGGDVSSDGGILLVAQADRLLGLTEAINKVIVDRRDPAQITHPQIDFVRQRVYGLALGYEDLNDHKTLRRDLAWQTALERIEALASSPTLCRFENRADRRTAFAISEIFVEQFIASFSRPPEELILDFDATDDRVHGMQEGRFFHGYYGDYCFLPLYVFCGEQLLVSYLRPSNIDGARHAWAILKLLVARLRRQWPQARIIFRGDSGFCRFRMLRWCERRRVDYIVGVAKNARLLALSAHLLESAKHAFEQSGTKARLFSWISYQAQSWEKPRRLIAKAEHTAKGANPRFLVSSLYGSAQKLYDELYCARGEMENRIKEQQLGLFADRTSCSDWWANQLRLLFSSAAYILLEAIRRIGLEGTELCRAQATTIRLKLLKIGTVIVRNTRRIRLFFTSAFPLQALFAKALSRLSTA